jgi:hypothetical protein
LPVICPDCRASAAIAGDVVHMVHRHGCPFALAPLEAEAVGKPVATMVGGRVARLVTTLEDQRPS